MRPWEHMLLKPILLLIAIIMAIWSFVAYLLRIAFIFAVSTAVNFVVLITILALITTERFDKEILYLSAFLAIVGNAELLWFAIGFLEGLTADPKEPRPHIYRMPPGAKGP